MAKQDGDFHVLIVDDNTKNLQLLMSLFDQEGYQIHAAQDGEQALKKINAVLPDLILLDVMMPVMDGFTTCKQLKASRSTKDIPIIFLSARTESENIVKGFELGAVDYVTKPFQREEVLARAHTHLTLHRLQQQLEDAVEKRTAELRKAFKEIEALKEQLQTDNVYLRQEIKDAHNFANIIGGSGALKYVTDKIQQIAATDTTVLILGETGTGKELVARAIHDRSPRKNRPLIKVDCTTLPSSLVESELFGHEKGAFTGALAQRIGRFEIADGATIFIDEIGELPLQLQPKLLRVLQDGEFERVGNYQPIKTDIRVIAATNRNLEKEIKKGNFREDLWYRLNIFPIILPPLRDRKDDIPLLAQHFIEKLNKKMGKQIKSIPAHFTELLESYAWPGNVRELENIIERIMVTSIGGSLNLTDLFEFREFSHPRKADSETLDEVEKIHIINVLVRCKWQIEGNDGAAKVLGINPSTLRFKMKKMEIQRPEK